MYPLSNEISPVTMLVCCIAPSCTALCISAFQVETLGASLTAKNSTSLQRAPGPPTLSVKGESTNYPFWPGREGQLY